MPPVCLTKCGVSNQMHYGQLQLFTTSFNLPYKNQLQASLLLHSLCLSIYSSFFSLTDTQINTQRAIQIPHLFLLSLSLSLSLSVSHNSNTAFDPLTMVLVKLADWVLYKLLANSCYRAARKMKNYGFLLKNSTFRSPPSSQQPTLFPSITKCCLDGRDSDTLVCDVHGVLLRSNSFFPYFMLIAFEGGSIFRAFLLLLSCSFLWVLDYELKLRVMIFISFCGLKTKNIESVGRAVLPKFYLENLNRQAYEILASTGSKVVFTSVPRVVVEGFLRDYLGVDCVKGTELHTIGGYFTGFVSGSGFLVKHRALKEYFGDKIPDVGLGNSSLHDQLFLSLCKVHVYV